MKKNPNDLSPPSTSEVSALTHEEHVARAVLLAGNHGGNLWYDAYTNAYRPRSPGGHAYKYSGCIDADTLEPLGKGEALARERKKGCKNTVTSKRIGFPYEPPPNAMWQPWHRR